MYYIAQGAIVNISLKSIMKTERWTRKESACNAEN